MSYPQNFVKPSESIWKLPTYKVTLAVDTEYVSKADYPTQMLTTQIAFSEKPEECLVIEHPSVGLNRLPTWQTRSIYSTALGYKEVSLPDGQPPDGYMVVEHLMFFAPNDLLRGCFRDLADQRRIQAYCKQDARIRISTKKAGDTRAFIALEDHLKLGIYVSTEYGILELVLVVKDLGKLAVGGLAVTAKGLGLEMSEKTLMDEWKSKMDEAYSTDDLELFENFVKYAKPDATILFQMRAANNLRVKNIFDVHGLPVPKNEVLTTGSLVAKLITAYLNKVIGETAAYKLFTYTNNKGKIVSYELEMMLEESTVAYFAKNKKDSKKSLLALVQGGRAKNETPLVISKTGVIGDIDLASAYATIIRLLTYPVGLPTTYGQHHESKAKPQTLGQWLRKNEDELLPRLWHVLVDGKLAHDQDLVSSKLIDEVEVIKKYNSETCKVPAEFRLYLNELENGVITSDTLEILRNVCSSQELSEWMNLEVKAGMFYAKSLRCNSPEEWYEKTAQHIEETGGSVEETADKKTGKTFTVDNRSRFWLAVPMSGFIDPYIKQRKVFKDEMKAVLKVEGKNDKYYQLHAKQEAMKLVCNVCYGVLASPYFKVGNVCLANNITAIARGLVWMSAKALGLYQTITDGGAGDINAVRTWQDKKPSMDTLAKFRDPSLLNKNIRSRLSTKPLGSDGSDLEPWVISADVASDVTIVKRGMECFKCNEGGWKHFDRIAMDHVRDYFRSESKPVDLLAVENGVKFEYKDMYVEYVGHSQTNYRLTRADEAQKTKARGHKIGKPTDKKYRNEAGEMVTSEIVFLFEDLVKSPNAIPAYQPLKIESILKCNQANEMAASKDKDNVYWQHDLVAGDSIYKNVWLRPLSLSMFHWKTQEQFEKWDKKNEKLKATKGYGLELYYLNSNGSVRYRDAVETIETAINSGLNWVVSKVDIDDKKHLFKV